MLRLYTPCADRTPSPTNKHSAALASCARTKYGGLCRTSTKPCFCLVNERINLRKLFFEAYKLF
jgi:hypothetical protein